MRVCTQARMEGCRCVGEKIYVVQKVLVVKTIKNKPGRQKCKKKYSFNPVGKEIESASGYK